MKLYRVNRRAAVISWVLLCLWFGAAAAFVLFLVAGHAYWWFLALGVGFLLGWGTYSYQYPRWVLVSHKSMAFVMAGDHILVVDSPDMSLNDSSAVYTIEVGSVTQKTRRKLRLERRSVNAELRRDLEKLFKRRTLD